MDDLIRQFQKEVLDWFAKNGRTLPWRQTTDPYHILVSEIMLQQTQVDRVIPKYEAWLRQFPTVEHLASTSPATVIQAWSGLGYNRRALFLQKAARAIAERGSFPTQYAELVTLPGIGPYTAAAVLSFAFNADIALHDTNIKRIYQLIIFGDQVEPTDKQVTEVAEQFLPQGHSRVWHGALMDIGTIIAKGRGAAQQQALLVDLFPILKNFPLPQLSDQPLKRPKQSEFKSSRRYWRGRIIAKLAQSQSLTKAEVTAYLQGLDTIPYSIDELLQSLVRDGLIIQKDNSFLLPE